MSSHRISVILPVYNGARYLPAAVNSVLSQSRPADEIIVVDDGSTDGSDAIAESFGRAVTLIRQTNRGAGAARNTGIEQTTGSLVAFLDADDIWLPESLAHHCSSLGADDNAAIAWGQAIMAVETDGRPYEDWRGQPQWPLCVSTMVFRREFFTSIGTFSELHICEDLDLLLRAKEQNAGMVRHPHLVSILRRHGSNLTNDRAATDRARFVAIKRSFERRRAAAGPNES